MAEEVTTLIRIIRGRYPAKRPLGSLTAPAPIGVQRAQIRDRSSPSVAARVLLLFLVTDNQVAEMGWAGGLGKRATEPNRLMGAC